VRIQLSTTCYSRVITTNSRTAVRGLITTEPLTVPVHSTMNISKYEGGMTIDHPSIHSPVMTYFLSEIIVRSGLILHHYTANNKNTC